MAHTPNLKTNATTIVRSLSRDISITPFEEKVPTVLNRGTDIQLPAASNDPCTTYKPHCKYGSRDLRARTVILQALQQSPQTTIDFRERLGVMSPAPGVFGLRREGHNILTLRVNDYTADGVIHSGVARYVLLQCAPQYLCQLLLPLTAANDDDKADKKAA